MTISDLIKAGRPYDALLLTVDLMERTEHEKPDIGGLIEAYHLCHTKNGDFYLLDMIKSGLLNILYDTTQKGVQTEELLKIAEVISSCGNSMTSKTNFEEYLSDFLYQVADSMYSKGDSSAAYLFLSAIATLHVPVRLEYVLLEKALKESLQIRTAYTAFMNSRQQQLSSEPSISHLQTSSQMRKQRFLVDILLEFPVVWCKVKSLYDALSKDSSFDCHLVAINMQEFALDSTTQYPAFLQFLNERDIPFVPEAAYNLSERRPDVLIYTNPYDGHHPHFAVEYVRQQGVRVVYLPYSIPFFVREEHRGVLYDLPIHRYAWRIYVRAQRERRKYGMYCASGNAHVEIAGAPIVDYLSEQKEKVKPDSHFRKTFLWGIDYGFDNHTATFGEYGERILKYFVDHPQYGLIVRPHPLFYGMVTKRGAVSKEAVHSFYEYCNAAPNVFLDLDGDLTEAFCKSDALISDISSILVEYLPMGRPVMYLNTQDTPNYKDYQEDDSDVLAHYYSGDSFDHIVKFIEMVAAGKDPMREERDSILGKYFYRYEENIGENIKENLKDVLQNL